MVIQPFGRVPPDQPELTVFYDGDCPLCSREIAFYGRCRGADRIKWLDVSQTTEPDVAAGLSREQATRRFHVQLSDGRFVSGGRAFAELWAVLPGLAVTGRMCQRGPLAFALDFAYRAFLPLRPWLQRIVRRRA
jgi:predicted DCC family thiol-disulfide oxidoreductase YuxK